MSVEVVTPLIPAESAATADRLTALDIVQQQQEEQHEMRRQQQQLVVERQEEELSDCPKRRSGILNVWTAPSINQLQIIESSNQQEDDYDSQYSSRKPSAVSSLEEQLEEEEMKPQERDKSYGGGNDQTTEWEREHHHKAFEAAVSLLDGILEDNRRKTSDPVMAKRSTETRRNALTKQRCFSDSTGRVPVIASTTGHVTSLADDNSSAVGGDSGIGDYHSIRQSTGALSDNESGQQRPPGRRSGLASCNMVRTGSLDERALRYSREKDTEQEQTKNSKVQRYGRMTKHLSMSSMGESSDTISIGSLFDVLSSTQSMATELLSSLGFGDFDSPLLIPDRFIPRDAETAKPSVMLEQTLLGVYSDDVQHEPLVSCSIASSVADPQREFEPAPLAAFSEPQTEIDLPLGATADNFIPTKLNHPTTPPDTPPPSPPPYQSPPQHQYIQNTPLYNRSLIQLETVPEETASDLSPSPRWLSPRVSLDHSYYDLSMGQLGSSLNMASRKRSLPNREGYRMSMESLLSEQDSTIYFSITSYDDDIAREQEKEKEDLKQFLPPDDNFYGRRRRKGVHGAPQELLAWLQDQGTPEEDEDEEMPWPFNEQAHIRRSLTEFQYQQRLSQSSNSTIRDRSLSPGCEDPLEGVFQRRFSVNGPLKVPSNVLNETRRLSLPSNSSYVRYNKSRLSPGPPSRGTTLETTIDEECGHISPEPDNTSESDNVTDPNSLYQNSTRLPPGMTRSDALEFKRESKVLKEELSIAQQKLRDAERVLSLKEEDNLRRISDTEEWLRSELWMKERKTRELEEALEGVQRDYKLLQQNRQIAVARAKEEVRDKKDKEISEMKQKMEQKNLEYREKVSKLEDECRQLRLKEAQLLKKASQQGVKVENEELHKEIARLKEQLRLEKQAMATAGKEKATEVKQVRSKAQLEKEEALKNQREYLTKLHQTELSSLRQLVHQSTPGGERESQHKFRAPVIHASSPGSKLETKKLHYQLERMEGEIRSKNEEIIQLKTQLKLFHKEHMQLQKEIACKTQH